MGFLYDNTNHDIYLRVSRFEVNKMHRANNELVFMGSEFNPLLRCYFDLSSDGNTAVFCDGLHFATKARVSDILLEGAFAGSLTMVRGFTLIERDLPSILSGMKKVRRYTTGDCECLVWFMNDGVTFDYRHGSTIDESSAGNEDASDERIVKHVNEIALWNAGIGSLEPNWECIEIPVPKTIIRAGVTHKD